MIVRPIVESGFTIGIVFNVYIYLQQTKKHTNERLQCEKLKLRSIYFTVCCLQTLTTKTKLTTSAFKKQSCDT